MPRRGAAPRRELAADPVYDSTLVTQVINKVLQRGKRAARPFRAVAGGGKGGGFAPAIDGTTRHAAEDGVNGRVLTVSSSPGINQRHCDMDKLKSINLHGHLW